MFGSVAECFLVLRSVVVCLSVAECFLLFGVSDCCGVFRRVEECYGVFVFLSVSLRFFLLFLSIS